MGSHQMKFEFVELFEISITQLTFKCGGFLSVMEVTGQLTRRDEENVLTTETAGNQKCLCLFVPTDQMFLTVFWCFTLFLTGW